jgi:hypothetical protein
LLSEAATAPSETFLILERIAPAPSESGSSWRGEFFSGGAMSERQTIPIAYVTKWATTVGIRIIRDGEVTPLGAIMKVGGLYATKNDWTEDKVEAESRYRVMIDSARKAAQRKVEKLAALYRAAPKYTEAEP